MAALKYFISGSPTMFGSPKETIISGFTQFLDDTFYNASDIHTIQKEYPFASGSYVSIDVRINYAINDMTGVKLSDDFKKLLFKSTDEALEEGEKVYFSDNYWLCVNTNSIKSLAASATVRRCNNVLKWRSSDGTINQEHAIIDYKIGTPQNKSLTDPVMPEGTILIISQLNSRTTTITENQRFLFGRPGNWMCYKVYGGGVNNYFNANTTDNISAKLLELAMGKSQVNEDEDDIVNGIADYYKNAPSTSGSPTINSIRILPNQDYVLQGDTQTYTCYLMSGSSTLPNTFVFTGGSDVPVANYNLLTLSDNSFSIENVKLYTSASLIVNCVSGSSTRAFPISLRGAW